MTIILVSGLNHDADRVENEFPEIATACSSESKNVREVEAKPVVHQHGGIGANGDRDHH
jgi:hypothetical protein